MSRLNTLRTFWPAFALVPLLLLSACTGSKSDDDPTTAAISGAVEGGLRVLTIDATAKDQQFTIYRGDYVRVVPAGTTSLTVNIPHLDVEKNFPVAEGEKAYFKVPNTGSFTFTAGQGSGVIHALDYAASAYREVTSAQAAELIANVHPVIVDVRTSREFAGGHLESALLIPVQEFQKRVGELEAHRNDPVFVYCRTGNRSTVAAKILVDKEFTNVVNLRRGIVDWQRNGHPVIK